MKRLYVTKHALVRMFERNITPHECEEVLEHGVVIEEYPDDKPFPSRLVAGTVNGRYIHLVVSQNNEISYLITAYKPDPDLWEDDFLKRRK